MLTKQMQGELVLLLKILAALKGIYVLWENSEVTLNGKEAQTGLHLGYMRINSKEHRPKISEEIKSIIQCMLQTHSLLYLLASVFVFLLASVPPFMKEMIYSAVVEKNETKSRVVT